MQSLHDSSNSISREIVGGKAARLFELINLGFRVKPAYILDTRDVERICHDGKVHPEALDHIRSKLICEHHGFAVRSSATDEDGELSWAGQFATELFVNPERTALESAIRTCALAMTSPTVLSYAKSHNTSVPRLAIIVQEMVPAKIAGVTFTRDPTTHADEMVIEAVSGVGESLVSGHREPSRYYLCKKTGTVLRHNGSNDPALSDAVLQELYCIGQKLEAHYACPQDIEWAIDHEDVIFLTQCRDVTTKIGNASDIRLRIIAETHTSLESERARLEQLGITYPFDVLSDTNISELLTQHPSQMTYGLFTYVFGHGMGAIRIGRNLMGYDIGDELLEGSILLIGGQPRVSIVHDACTFRVKGIDLPTYTNAVVHYLQCIRNNERKANYPEIGLYEQWPSLDWIRQVFGPGEAESIQTSYETFHSHFVNFERDLAERIRTHWLPAWQLRIREMEARLQKGESAECLFQEVIELMRTDACKEFVFVARVGFFSYDRLRRHLIRLYKEDGDAHINVLTAGIPLELNPNLRFSIALHAWRTGTLTFEELTAEFGHLGIHEMDIPLPRYWEDPKLMAQLAEELHGNAEAELETTATAAKNLKQKLLSELPGSTDPSLREEIEIVRCFLPLREVVKFEFLRGYDLIRRTLLKMEAEHGWPKDLIFHLDPLDLVSETKDWGHLRELATRRLQQWNDNRQVYIPKVLFSDDLEQIGHPPSLENIQFLSGIGVTNFITEGEVVVMLKPDDATALRRLRPGSILVTETTDPAWTPILSIIGRQGGLVTEVGGLLAHGAVYAREVGLAAVLNVPSATQILKTGMRVRVNGPDGKIEVLESL